ncbi:MAG: 5-(carboxyamino)imidazole ribonucleotide synthase [Methylococcales bacterium]
MNIGIVGGGQLARMMMLAGYSLGLRFITLDPAADACAGQLGELIHAEYDDEQALRRLAAESDVVTFEFENVPDRSIQILSGHIPVFPPSEALRVAQDRLTEKALFMDLGIPTPGFRPVNSLKDLEIAAGELGIPMILKTRRLGYDGKGQVRIHARDEIRPAFEKLDGGPLIAERYVRFDREISMIAVRALSNETRYYPVTENTHRNGILHLSICRPGDPRQATAENYIDRILEHLKYVGVLALEFFEKDGELLANEIAPRVHNSGHWTIEGAEISQFENHLRAVAGLPLGSTAAKGYSAMVNFIGDVPSRAGILSHDDIHLHAYGKEPRPGRKIGHATVNVSRQELLAKRIEELVGISVSGSDNEKFDVSRKLPTTASR